MFFFSFFMPPEDWLWRVGSHMHSSKYSILQEWPSSIKKIPQIEGCQWWYNTWVPPAPGKILGWLSAAERKIFDVLNILIAPLEKDESGIILAYLGDTVYLEECNNSPVAVKCLQRPLDQLNSFMLGFSQMLNHAGLRNRRYLQFMTKNLPPGRKATMPQNPCATQWNLWFTAVLYHPQHFGVYKELTEKEIDVTFSLWTTLYYKILLPPKTHRPSETQWDAQNNDVFKYLFLWLTALTQFWLSPIYRLVAKTHLCQLHEMLHDPSMTQSLQLQVNIITDMCKLVIELLDIFQSRHPIVTKCFWLAGGSAKEVGVKRRSQLWSMWINTLKDLTWTEWNRHTIMQWRNWANTYQMDNLPFISCKRSACLILITQSSWMTVSPPTNPSQVSVQCRKMNWNYTSNTLVQLHWNLQRVEFWDGLQETLPVLSVLARCYKLVIVNSADAERNNNIYKLVLSSRRRSVTDDNLKALVFLCHNQRLTSGAFQMDEEDEDIDAFEEA